MRCIAHSLVVAVLLLAGCRSANREYGVEQPLFLPGQVRQTWAVAPVLNNSGQREVDSILQADLLYHQLQQVAGLNVIPVNRVVEIYQGLRIDKVQSEEQAAIVCDLLGCDALVVAQVSIYDPFEPPKMAASLQLFRKGGYRRPANIDPRDLIRPPVPPVQPAPTTAPSAQPTPGFLQAVGMFDAANGSVRQEVLRFARGRADPDGPYKERLYLVEMDRFCEFVYHNLIAELLGKVALQ